MKKKTNIKTMIRKIVREEVAMAINEVITELKQPTQQVSQPQPKERVVENKMYTKNSVLNDVLNETAQNDEWKVMGAGTYDSSKMNDVLQTSYSDMMHSGNNSSTQTQTVNPNDPMSQFLNKDYRSIMKAIDKKQEKR